MPPPPSRGIDVLVELALLRLLLAEVVLYWFVGSLQLIAQFTGSLQLRPSSPC